MQKDEAVKRLENWLKIPVDYKDVVPALADLKYTDLYEPYLKRVADADYRSAASIDKDVELYITGVRYDLGRKKQDYERKLDAMAGGDRLASRSGNDDDLLDDIDPRQAGNARKKAEREKVLSKYMETTGAKRRKRKDAYDDDDDDDCEDEASIRRSKRSSRDDDYDDEEYDAAIRIRKGCAICPCCGKKMRVQTENGYSNSTIVWLVILFLVCFPLCIVVAICGLNKQVTLRCPRCRRVSSKRDANSLPALRC